AAGDRREIPTGKARVNRPALFICLLSAGLLACGCAGPRASVGAVGQAEYAEPVRVTRPDPFGAEARRQILALNPEQGSEMEIRGLLVQMPAPRIICIHGGLLPIKHTMNSFARFLIGMGYPESSLRDPADGGFTYGYYEASEKLAGEIAWYYERDGLRPML